MISREQIINKVAINLVENAGKLSYGTVSTTLTIHQGKLKTVCHEVKEVVRKVEEVQSERSI